MNSIDKANVQQPNEQDVENQADTDATLEESDFEISVRKIDFPVKPRGVLAE